MNAIPKPVLITIIALSVVASAVFAAPIPPMWNAFALSMLILLAALLLLRRQNKSEAAAAHAAHNIPQQLHELLDEEQQFINRHLADKTNSPEWVTALEDHHELFSIRKDELLEGFIRSEGLKKYIAVATVFARAERFLNRGLSAAIDHYYEEAREMLRLGADTIEQTQIILSKELPEAV